MATGFQVTFDCASPDRLAHFWADLLHYKIQDPPEGFATWEDFLREAGIPEEQWDSASAVVDPDGAGPRIFFQKVPEPKTTKNRVHLDVNVSGGYGTELEERKRIVASEVERAVGLGATRIQEFEGQGEYHVVMNDPEGNEFCLQ